jgi:hypothetical protein
MRQHATILAFIHIEKAAGITINRILRRSFGVHHCDVEPWSKTADIFSASDLTLLQKLYPNLKSIAGHRVKPYSDLGDNVRYFTFLREPIARCASHYQYQIQRMRKQISFDEWISDEQYHNFQTKKIVVNADLGNAIALVEQLPIFMGLIERFDESIIMLQRWVGGGQLDVAYRKENVAHDASIKNQLVQSLSTRAKLEQANDIDLQLYQYVEKTLYPKQKEQHGDSLEVDMVFFQSANYPNRKLMPYVMGLAKRNLFYKPFLYSHRFFKR